MSTASRPLLVGFADSIRHDQELFDAARQATGYLESLIEKYHLEGAERELMSAGSEGPRPATVIAHLSESDRLGIRQTNCHTTRQRLLDPVARDVLAIRLLQEVLKQRWYQVGKEIDRGIDELELEESANGHAD